MKKDWDELIKRVEEIEAIHHPDHGYFGVHIVNNTCTIAGTKFRSDVVADPPVYYVEQVLSDKYEATHRAVELFWWWYKKEYVGDES